MTGTAGGDGSTCATAPAVDNRLHLIAGRRLSRLRKQDLPEVAEALLDAVRRRAVMSGVRWNNARFIWVRGPKVNVAILKEDWALIEPFFQDDTFTDSVTPTRSVHVGWLRREVTSDSPVNDGSDKELYDRILSQLKLLFPEEWPTSTL